MKMRFPLVKSLVSCTLIVYTLILSSCQNPLAPSEGKSVPEGFRPGDPPSGGSTNTAPVASDGTLSTNLNVAASSTLIATDANSNTLTYSIVSNPSNGTVSITNTATGAYTYTPTASYTGSDSFTFKANDGTADSNTATITITVNNSATTPVSANISPAAFNEDTQSGVITLSYTDPNGDLATSCALSALSGVTVTQACACDGSGVCTVKVTGTSNTNGAASFSYTVTANGEASNTAAASFSINAVNDTPTLTAISALNGATEDTAFTISYATLAAAADEADVDGDTLSFRVEAVSTGTLTKGGVAVTPGTTLLSTGESLVWTPASNASGTLNSFTAKAYDGTTVSGSAIQVQAVVASANDAPTLTSIATLAGATEDTAFTISYAALAAAADEADTEGDTISFRVEAVTTGTLTKGGVAVTPGTTLLSTGESLVWTPASNANGTLNAFTVKAHDGTSASSSAIQVQASAAAAADTPTLTAVSTLTGATEDTTYSITYAALSAAADEADGDGDTLSFRVEAVSTGTLTKGGVAVTPGTTLLSTGETLVWTPASNANGTLNAFTVKAHDGALVSSSAIQVQVSVATANDAPTLTTVTTLTPATEDTAFTIAYADLTSAGDEADTDGDTLSFQVAAVSTGTLTKGGVAVSAGSTLISAGESLVWTPASNANGTLNAFTIKAHDGTTVSSSAIQVQVSVAAVNDAPTLTTLSTLAGATEDTAFTIAYADLTGAGDEADVEGSAISFRVEAVTTGTLTKGGVAVTPGTTLISTGESLVWTPASNANGTLNAFTVKAHDGTTVSTTAIQVQVSAAVANDAPTLTAISTLTGATEDTAFTIAYADLAGAADEADVDGNAISFQVEAVSTGTLTKGGVAVTPGSTLLSTGESLVWTGAANANGTLNAFTVKAHDGTTVSSSAIQVQVTAAAAADTPTLTAISALSGASVDTAFTISYATLAAAANEADGDGDALSFRVEAVSTGTLTKGGVAVTPTSTLLSTGESLVWTPAAAASGTLNAFTVKAYDGALASSSAIQVQVSVSTDLTDDDNTATGFAGGTKVGVQWNTNSINKLILGPDTDCDGNMSEGETVYTNCAELDSSWTPQWSSLVSYYKMNESSWNGTANEIVDSKGTSHAASYSGTTTTSSAKMGAYAGSFDGSNDYVAIGGAAGVIGGLVNGAPAMSFQAWVKYTSLDSGQYDNVVYISRVGNATNAALWVSIRGDGANAGKLLVGGRSLAADTFREKTSTTVLAASTWYHVVAVLDFASGTVNLAINGVSETATSAVFGSTTYVHSGTPTYWDSISANPSNSATYPFTGSIDDVAIWKVALTSAQIQSIYTRQSAKYAGQFTSRIMNYGSSIAWDGLKWLTTLPFGKELTGDANNSGTITAADSETSTDYPSLVGSTGATTDDNLMSGLRGLWHFNEASWNGTAGEVKDKSGNANNGVRVGTATTSATGMFGSSGTFNGTTDYISIPDSTSLNIPTALSISAWVKRERTGTREIFLGKSDGNSVNSYWFEFTGGNLFNFFTAVTQGNSVRTISDTSWHHYVGTWDGTTQSTYIDGVFDSSRGAVGSIATNAQTLGIGRLGGLGALYFKGEIDEVAIWSRALHADEIKQLYRRGANRIKYQVRTCTAADCSDNPTWLGNDNTKASYFSELHNYAPYNFDVNNCSATNLILTGSPSLLFDCFTGALSNLTSQNYFQYRAILESDDASTNCNYGSGATWCSPELKSVEVKP